MSLSEALDSALEVPTGTADAIIPSLLEAIRLHLGMEVGFVTRFDETERTFEYVSDDGVFSPIAVGDSDDLEKTYCHRVVTGRIPGLIHDAAQFEDVQDLAVTHDLNIRAHVSVPIQLDEQTLYGTLCCFSTEANNDLTDRDLRFMAVVGDLVGTILNREQAGEARLDDLRAHIDDMLHSGAMQAVWQPIVNIATGEITKVEALSRFFTTPYRPPNEWFDSAALVGRHIDLERNALIKGLSVLGNLPESVKVSCNLSSLAILDPDIQEFLHSRKLSRTIIELTEHDIVHDYDHLIEVLAPLRSKGMLLAIDDFGAGYSSFKHILDLDPDIIKLDMHMVRNINRRPKAQSVLRALLAFTEENDTQLVAEGVETSAERETLMSLGVTRAQGYFFHKPLIRDDLLKALQEN